MSATRGGGVSAPSGGGVGCLFLGGVSVLGVCLLLEGWCLLPGGVSAPEGVYPSMH